MTPDNDSEKPMPAQSSTLVTAQPDLGIAPPAVTGVAKEMAAIRPPTGRVSIAESYRPREQSPVGSDPFAQAARPKASAVRPAAEAKAAVEPRPVGGGASGSNDRPSTKE